MSMFQSTPTTALRLLLKMPLAVLAAATSASCTAYESFLDPGLRRDDDFQSDAPNGVFPTEARIQYDFQSDAPNGVFPTEARIQYDFQSDAPNGVFLTEARIQYDFQPDAPNYVLLEKVGIQRE